MKELHRFVFDMYALSLPRGLGFGEEPPIRSWRNEDGSSCGIVTKNHRDGSFGFLVMRRRTDAVWETTHSGRGLISKEDAYTSMESHAKDCHRGAIPSGTLTRPSLAEIEDRSPSEVFTMLARKTHHLAAWTLNQLYLALPRPDRNWVSDCQTKGFHTRLWEAHLLGCFREQGLLVTQPHKSPDFRIENRLGDEAWVEAVTANPAIPFNHVNAPAAPIPVGREALFFGPAALRFAKTLGNKLDRRYDLLPHVQGKPFMLAVADFQSPASMLWSREGLIGYLYGEGAQIAEINGVRSAVPMPATHLLGDSRFPAGLFADSRRSELSAVIFSNACSIAKLNRVAISACGAPEGLRYTRIGKFFDRTSGALEGIPFCLDMTSDEYRGLWPQMYEPWSAELEVFHNPFAANPVPRTLLPEATHWFTDGDDMICSSHYDVSILWSQTRITDTDKPAPRLEDFRPDSNTEV